jgi:tetratricopeptide (TPR) repeat protein
MPKAEKMTRNGIITILIGWVLSQAYPLPAQIRPMLAEPQVRAVVVGVARYQDARIPALRFSNRDAAHFAAWLQSPAGGEVPADRIRLLTDEQATYGQMVSAYTWLLENSGKDDLAILYFSGHGDMENQTVMNHGFLLAHDAPGANYMAGGFPIFYLQSIVRTLSTQNQSQVLLIADACRAGKLAGEDFSGSQATLKSMSDQFANETKILSCQPNEYSQEDQRWGGGHGVFTWYLVDGLTGMADRNQDQQVTLLEIQRFLEDHVPLAVAPKSQIPIVTGNKGMVIHQVNPEALDALRHQRELGGKEGMGGPAIGPDLALRDSVLWSRYLLFGEALRTRRLLEPEDSAAYTLYRQIADHPDMAPYRSAMRLDLSAALQEEAQKAINDYLAASPAELHRRWSFDTSYQRYPNYLETCAEILGERHFLHRELMLKSAYFRGLNLRLEGETSGDPARYRQARKWQEAALGMDSSAAFVFNELGLLARRENRFEESIGHFRKALDYAPTWVLARTNLCGSLVELGRYPEAMAECATALQRDSTFALAHYNLGKAYYQSALYEEALQCFQLAVRMDPLYYDGWLQLGMAQWRNGHWTDMMMPLIMADSLRPSTLFREHDLLTAGRSYFIRNSFGQALPFFEAVFNRNPDNPENLYWLSNTLVNIQRPVEARLMLEHLDSLAQFHTDSWYFSEGYRFNLALLSVETGQYAKALERFEVLSKASPGNPDLMLGIALSHARLNNASAALMALGQAISLGYRDALFLQETDHLIRIREMPEFKTLLQRIESGE